MLEIVTNHLNHLPSEDGVSNTISPSTIILGEGPIDVKYPTVEFGSYVLLYTSTQNNLNRRSVPCIALNPSNGFVGHNFLSLESGKKLHGYKWVVLPMDEWVITQVGTLAAKEGQLKLVNTTF